MLHHCNTQPLFSFGCIIATQSQESVTFFIEKDWNQLDHTIVCSPNVHVPSNNTLQNLDNIFMYLLGGSLHYWPIFDVFSVANVGVCIFHILCLFAYPSLPTLTSAGVRREFTV